MQKGVSPYKSMDDWNKFSKTSLLEKEDFYSSLTMQHITVGDLRRAKRIWKDLALENQGLYHDLYVQNDKYLLADVLESFQNMCFKITEFDLGRFLTPPGLAWQVVLKKTKLILKLLTDIDMLMMLERGIRSGICYAIHRFAEAKNKYVKD